MNLDIEKRHSLLIKNARYIMKKDIRIFLLLMENLRKLRKN